MSSPDSSLVINEHLSNSNGLIYESPVNSFSINNVGNGSSSLLTPRVNSLPPPHHTLGSSPQQAETSLVGDYSSSSNDHSFYQQLSIQVEQPVTGMSISPSKRDIVLASRLGLFIVDLESPFDPPRSLPYFSRWEVAEVQWNPHRVRDTWIASTCNHKVLVWNLMQPKLKSVEFILDGHQRAISDLSWSPFHPEILATASLDTKINLWDLRKSPSTKPSHTFMSFDLAVAQIDFNPLNEFLLATGQESEFKVWDLRRGNRPIHTIDAHDRKISNVHWNPNSRSELLTCSHDRTIKFWDVNNPTTPTNYIQTTAPIARARYTPFGHGVLCAPLRTEANELTLWDTHRTLSPVFKYQGHTGLVREFVWRIHGALDCSLDQREFQLITFSLDRQLRLWPVGKSQLNSVGHHPPTAAPSSTNNNSSNSNNTGFSFRTPRHSTISIPSPVLHNNTNWSLCNQKRLSIDDEDQLFGNPSPPTYHQQRVRSNTTVPNSNHSHPSNILVRSLGDELSSLAQSYPQLQFERVNVAGRTCTLTLHGPWAKDGSAIFLRLNLKFPLDYPNLKPPQFELQPSGGILSMANRSLLQDALDKIAHHHVQRKHYCLKYCVGYLLGDRKLLTTETLPSNDLMLLNGSSNNYDESGLGDDEENDELDYDYGLSSFNHHRKIPNPRDLLTTSNSNNSASNIISDRDDQNIPFPRMCGGVFSSTGQLVLYFSKLNCTSAKLNSSRARDNQYPSLTDGDGMSSYSSSSSSSNNSLRGFLRTSYYPTHPRSYESLELFRTMTRLPPRISSRNELHYEPTSNNHTTGGLDDLLTIPSLFYRPNSHQRADSSVTINEELTKTISTKKMESDTSTKEALAKGNLVIIHSILSNNLSTKTKYQPIIIDVALGISYQSYGYSLIQMLSSNRKLTKLNHRPDLARLWKLLTRVLLPPCHNGGLLDHYGLVWRPDHPFGNQLISSLIKYYERAGDFQTLGMLGCFLLDRIKKPVSGSINSGKEILHNEGTFISQYQQPSILTSSTIPKLDSPKDYFSATFYHQQHINHHHSTSVRSNNTNKSPVTPFWGLPNYAPSPRTPSRSLVISNGNINPATDLNNNTLPVTYGGVVPSSYSSYLMLTGSNQATNNQLQYTSPPTLSTNSKSNLNVVTPPLLNNNPASTPPFFSLPSTVPHVANQQQQRRQNSIGLTVQLINHQDMLSISKEQPGCGLIDQVNYTKLANYRQLYSDQLHRWGLICQRVALLKGSSDQTNGEDYQLNYVVQQPINNHASGIVGVRCAVCHGKVLGLASYCQLCGHGGHTIHMQSWFNDTQSQSNSNGFSTIQECPSGCGCQCGLNGGYLS